MSAKLIAAGQSAQQVSEQKPAPGAEDKKAPYSTGMMIMLQCAVGVAVGLTARNLVDGHTAQAVTTAVMGLPAAFYFAHVVRALGRHEKAQAASPPENTQASSFLDLRNARRQAAAAQAAPTRSPSRPPTRGAP